MSVVEKGYSIKATHSHRERRLKKNLDIIFKPPTKKSNIGDICQCEV